MRGSLTHALWVMMMMMWLSVYVEQQWRAIQAMPDILPETDLINYKKRLLLYESFNDHIQQSQQVPFRFRTENKVRHFLLTVEVRVLHGDHAAATRGIEAC